MASCFNCKAKPAKGWSAYCEGCQPVSADPPLTRGSCLCRPCGQVFTSISAFDLHKPGGCLDATTATRRNGDLMFAAYRTLTDGTPVYGDARNGARPEIALDARRNEISRPNGLLDVSSEGVAA